MPTTLVPRRLLAAPLLALAALLPLRAQPAAPGGVRGHVFNDATHEYVRNAEVRVEGASAVTYTENGGAFELAGLPAGPATLIVTYAGMQPVKTSVVVAPGQVVAQDIELKATSFGASGDTVRLDKFEISETRSGQAKAAAKSTKPIDDVRATAEYRLAMVPVLVERALTMALERAT